MIDIQKKRHSKDGPWTPQQECEVARLAAALDAQLERLLESRGQLCRGNPGAAGSWARRRIAQVERLRASMAVVDPRPSGDALRLWREAERLRWTLALSAWHLAQRESRRVLIPELTRDDVANEAAMGLYDAAVRFDPDRGFLFATYARWWIRAQTKNALAAAHLIVRLPDSARRRRARLLQAGGVAAVGTGARASQASHLLSSFASVSWQHVPASGGLTLEELTCDPGIARADDDLETREALAIAKKALFDSDDDLHRRIVIRRFGLDGSEAQTLRQIGERIGVSAERVRQLERDALRSLRDQVERVHVLPTTAVNGPSIG